LAAIAEVLGYGGGAAEAAITTLVFGGIGR